MGNHGESWGIMENHEESYSFVSGESVLLENHICGNH